MGYLWYCCSVEIFGNFYKPTVTYSLGDSTGMEMYNVSGHGNAENYLNQGAENPYLTSPMLEQIDAMYNEGAPEFYMDQGLYYPTATDYGYYCTGFESPGEWEDHHRVFGGDGPQIQYAGAQTESLPYVYFTPSYGYAQSPYNPYNPYLPGALVGVDAPYVGAQQYYTIPPYQDPMSSPAYVPVVVQPDYVSNNTTDPLLDTGVGFTHRSDGRNVKHGLPSSSVAFARNQTKTNSGQTNSYSKIPDGSRTNMGSNTQSFNHGSVSSGGFLSQASSHMLQGRGASGSIQPADNISSGKLLPRSNQMKVALPPNNGFSGFGSNVPGRSAVDKARAKIHSARTLNDLNGNLDSLDEMGGTAQGQIIIHTDQYNKDDFVVDYADAKFFVIKSYSEDDVHKSIKYNVWSSTPHGNKKLQNAYEDAQRVTTAGRSRCCPIFLFFSVNASGQFCGVAEMIGPVDFHKDMEFWQQDKWSGSFPVKWHIIKDVSNSCFRHIILENNENKPVTNSRDTQEIMCKQGVEMLKIFKNYASRTSLLDDFVYYEDRQRIMQEEKAKLMYKSLESPYLPALIRDEKLHSRVELPPNKDEKDTELNGLASIKETETIVSKQAKLVTDVADEKKEIEHSNQTVNSGDDIAPVLKIGSLSINPKQDEHEPPRGNPSSTDHADVVTVGSMPVKVNGFGESSPFLRVGSIQIDPRALQGDKGGGASAKTRTPH
ncbi:evolutionarily conserved C-terminal region 7 [Euphorbia peplus]|nr:evolutionarily conserved C-terminal region 7 [Euphorbia peplus]